MRHFVEQLAGVVEHAGFPVEGDEADGEAFAGDVWVLFLVLEDFVD